MNRNTVFTAQLIARQLCWKKIWWTFLYNFLCTQMPKFWDWLKCVYCISKMISLLIIKSACRFSTTAIMYALTSVIHIAIVSKCNYLCSYISILPNSENLATQKASVGLCIEICGQLIHNKNICMPIYLHKTNNYIKSYG